MSERERLLHEALRERSIKLTAAWDGMPILWKECDLCGDHAWKGDEPERHAPGCLAALAAGGEK